LIGGTGRPAGTQADRAGRGVACHIGRRELCGDASAQDYARIGSDG
jgi:hypothetical protein